MAGSRRRFLKYAAATMAAAGAAPAIVSAAFEPLEKTIGELQRAMTAG